jgi:HD superfamily phosphohydrolase YqeK
MSNDKLRRQIAYEAARMMYVRQESDYYRAKMKVARRICRGWVKPADLPTDQEIRDQIQLLARAGSANPTTAAALANGQRDSQQQVDRFHVYRNLLTPLETVKQHPQRHPEGDALYHSLQVFDLARDALPYDEEFQLAALLHDVGKAIDPRDHVAAGLAALGGHVTERTAWLIEHHAQAAALRDGTLGVRARRRLEAADDFDDLMLLYDCDRLGRQRGVQVPDVDEALEHLRQLAHANGAA